MMFRDKKAEERLWYVNLFTCIVHFTSVAVSIALWTDWPIPVTTSFLSWHSTDKSSEANSKCNDGNCYVKTSIADWPQYISLMGLVVAFHILSFSWQFMVLWPWNVQKVYHDCLAQGHNPFRWVEYALSAPLMMIVISAMLGEIDISVYVLLALCTSLLMGLGYLQEEFMQWTLTPHRMGWMLFTVMWSVPTFTFSVSLTKSQSAPPDRILMIVCATWVLMIVLFGCFGLVQVFHVGYYHETPFSNVARLFKKPKNVRTLQLTPPVKELPDGLYYRIEMAYGVLSATAKLALAILVIMLIRVREDTLNLKFVGAGDDVGGSSCNTTVKGLPNVPYEFGGSGVFRPFIRTGSAVCNSRTGPLGETPFFYGHQYQIICTGHQVINSNWHLAPEGAGACDFGTVATLDECKTASEYIMTNYHPGKQSKRSLYEAWMVGDSIGNCQQKGAWGGIPPGCALQTGGDWTPHYKWVDLNCDSYNPAYQLVCSGDSSPSPSLSPQNVLAGQLPPDFHLAPRGALTCDYGQPAFPRDGVSCMNIAARAITDRVIGGQMTRERIQWDEGRLDHDECGGGEWGDVPMGCSIRTTAQDLYNGQYHLAGGIVP